MIPIPWIVLFLPILLSFALGGILYNITNKLWLANIIGFGIPILIILWTALSSIVAETVVLENYEAISFEKNNSDYIINKYDHLVNLNKELGRDIEEGSKINIVGKRTIGLGIMWDIDEPYRNYEIKE